VVDPAFWNVLERHILDWEAQPNEYLLCRRTVRPNRHKPGEKFVREHRTEPMGVHGLHRWWVPLPPAGGRGGEGPNLGRADA